MIEYEDNLIGKDIPSYLDVEVRKQYTKSTSWLPFEAYDLVQCGYPYADHGEMILRSDGGVNKDNELLPSNGMWCKVDDVLAYLKTL